MAKAFNVGVRFLRTIHGKKFATVKVGDEVFDIFVSKIKVRNRDGSDVNSVSWAEAREDEMPGYTFDDVFINKDFFEPGNEG